MESWSFPKLMGSLKKYIPWNTFQLYELDFATIKNFEEKIFFDTHVCVMQYALHRIQKYLVIHYINYHLSF